MFLHFPSLNPLTLNFFILESRINDCNHVPDLKMMIFWLHLCLICCISCGCSLAALLQWQTSETALLLKQIQQQWWPRVLSLILVTPCLHPSPHVNSSKQIRMQVEFRPQQYPPESTIMNHINLSYQIGKLTNNRKVIMSKKRWGVSSHLNGRHGH